MLSVPVGVTRSQTFQPTIDDTAAAVGNVIVEAVATVAMALWVEATCGGLIHPYFEDNEASVGFRVAVDHTGPAFAGRPVDVHAEITDVSGRKVTFAVRVTQDGREVMTGEHVRAIVDLTRFFDGQAEAAERPQRPEITFYFDVHSPWAYAASTMIGSLGRRHNAPVVWRPLHLPNLMEQIDGLRPLDQSAARVAWYEQDVIDRMVEWGLAYDPHPDYPLRPSRAQRACVFAAQEGKADAFVQAVMRAYWAEQRDISDLAVLQDLADQADLTSRPVTEVVEDAAVKQVVADNTQAAIASGVFGVPSFFFCGKLYFGVDHLDMLERAVAFWQPGS